MVEVINGIPEGFEYDEYFSINFKAGGEIFNKYCKSCMDKEDCEMKRGLLQAMGENYPLWFRSHVPVKSTTPNEHWPFGTGESHVFCGKYRSPQQNLQGIEKDNIDGIGRLLEYAGIVSED